MIKIRFGGGFMNKREFCRNFGNTKRFCAFLLCLCTLIFAFSRFGSSADDQSTPTRSDTTLTAICATGGYTVKLDNASFLEGGRDDGSMLTDRVYTSVTAKSASAEVVGWMMVKGNEGKDGFSATVDIDFGYIASDVCRFYLRAFRNPTLNAEMPDEIKFYYSVDGKDYIKLGDAKTRSDITVQNCAAIYEVALEQGITAKYLRAVIESESEYAFWINEIGAAAYKETLYATKQSDGSIRDGNGVLYTLNGNTAAVIGYNAKPSRTVATKSSYDFNSDENDYVLGIGTGNAVKVITDFIGEGRINYSGVPNNVKYIVIHNTGTVEEETDAARYNRRMHTTPEETSWHYTVDDGIIYHSLADSAVGWHAGSGINYESIGLEICVNGAPKHSNGSFIFTGDKYEKWVNERFDKSLRNAAVLVAELLTRYGLKKDAVIQHYDSTEKNCPQWLRYKNGKYANDGTLWLRFIEYVGEYYEALNASSSDGDPTYANEICIPDYISVDGDVFPVTEIASDAFADNDSPFNTITVGNEVKSIASGAFDGNGELERVRFKSKNVFFTVKEDGSVIAADGTVVYDPTAYKSVAPMPKADCGLDIRELDGKYYIFCGKERYTLSQLANEYGADEFSARRLDGSTVGIDEIPGTGTVLSFDGVRIYLVLIGDVNGDALVGTHDYLLVKRTCLNTFYPLKRQSYAMRLRNTDDISVYDYILLKRHIMGTFNIYG